MFTASGTAVKHAAALERVLAKHFGFPVETLVRDPYAIYARHVLRLRELEAIDALPGHADRGIVIHAALERFVRDHPGALPADSRGRTAPCRPRRGGWISSSDSISGVGGRPTSSRRMACSPGVISDHWPMRSRRGNRAAP